MIINLGCASVDNHIPRDDNFDYHPLKNVIFIYYDLTIGPSLFNRTWALRWKRCLDSTYVVHMGMFI